MVLDWSDVMRTTSLGPAVFEVEAAHRWLVRDWLRDQDLPHAAQRDVHSPTVEAWALLDGGVTAISGYGLTSLPHGIRVVGHGALRLLLAELDVEGPAEPFPGESPVGLDELRRRHRVGARDSPEVHEQAELLATCRDAVLLRWVATTLFREAVERGRTGAVPAEPVEPPGRAAEPTTPASAIPAPAEPTDRPPAPRPRPAPTAEGTARWPAPEPDLPETGQMPLVSAERTPPGGSRL
jgi:hypothetical protein